MCQCLQRGYKLWIKFQGALITFLGQRQFLIPFGDAPQCKRNNSEFGTWR